MDITKSRKERIQERSKHKVRTGKKKQNPVMKKLSIIALIMSVLFGGTVAFASVNPDFLTRLSQFAETVFTTHNADITTVGNTTKDNQVTDLDSFLTGKINKIETDISLHADDEKTRVTEDIELYNSELQTAIGTQVDQDIQAKKTELTNTAEVQITNGINALDAKFNELFPSEPIQ